MKIIKKFHVAFKRLSSIRETNRVDKSSHFFLSSEVRNSVLNIITLSFSTNLKTDLKRYLTHDK